MGRRWEEQQGLLNRRPNWDQPVGEEDLITVKVGKMTDLFLKGLSIFQKGKRQCSAAAVWERSPKKFVWFCLRRKSAEAVLGHMGCLFWEQAGFQIYRQPFFAKVFLFRTFLAKAEAIFARKRAACRGTGGSFSGPDQGVLSWRAWGGRIRRWGI